jgi:hypothetical protein
MRNPSQKNKFRGGKNRGRGSRNLGQGLAGAGKTSKNVGEGRKKIGKGRGKPKNMGNKRKNSSRNTKWKLCQVLFSEYWIIIVNNNIKDLISNLPSEHENDRWTFSRWQVLFVYMSSLY